MNELKRYLSPTMDFIVMQSTDIVTLSNPETNTDNDNVWEDVYD